MFPYHKAMEKVKKKENIRLLNGNQTGWNDFIENTKWFNQQSHSSVIPAIYIQMFDQPGSRIIGAGFDCAKKEFYVKGITLRQNAVNILKETIEQVKKSYQLLFLVFCYASNSPNVNY